MAAVDGFTQHFIVEGVASVNLSQGNFRGGGKGSEHSKKRDREQAHKVLSIAHGISRAAKSIAALKFIINKNVQVLVTY